MPKWLDNLFGITHKHELQQTITPEPRLTHILEGEQVRQRQTGALIKELRRLEQELARNEK